MTAAIETLLCRRVANARWDDVAVPLRPNKAVVVAAATAAAAGGGPSEVSQLEAAEGLGVLYATEYVTARERLAASAATAADGGGWQRHRRGALA